MNQGVRDPIAFGHNQPKTENARIFEIAVKKSALYLGNNQVKLNTQVSQLAIGVDRLKRPTIAGKQ